MDFADLMNRIREIDESTDAYTVGCSQCGGSFKRDKKEGYSHCKDHKGQSRVDESENTDEAKKYGEFDGTGEYLGAYTGHPNDPRNDSDDGEGVDQELIDKLEKYMETAYTLDDIDDSDVYERIHATANILRVDPHTEEGFARAIEQLHSDAVSGFPGDDEDFNIPSDYGYDELEEYFKYEPSKKDGKPDDVLGRRPEGGAKEDPEGYKHMARTKDKNYPLGGPKGKLPEDVDNDEELDECGDMGPVPTSLQPDSVSMNVSMSGSGKGGIRDLMDILSKIDSKDVSGDDHGKVNLIGNDLEEFANEPEETTYPVDAVTATGNDLHSHGDNEVPKAHGGGNPYSMLKNKLESLYNEIKTKGTL